LLLLFVFVNSFCQVWQGAIDVFICPLITRHKLINQILSKMVNSSMLFWSLMSKSTFYLITNLIIFMFSYWKVATYYVCCENACEIHPTSA
jgi:hypothetical protein